MGAVTADVTPPRYASLPYPRAEIKNEAKHESSRHPQHVAATELQPVRRPHQRSVAAEHARDLVRQRVGGIAVRRCAFHRDLLQPQARAKRDEPRRDRPAGEVDDDGRRRHRHVVRARAVCARTQHTAPSRDDDAPLATARRSQRLLHAGPRTDPHAAHIREHHHRIRLDARRGEWRQPVVLQRRLRLTVEVRRLRRRLESVRFGGHAVRGGELRDAIDEDLGWRCA